MGGNGQAKGPNSCRGVTWTVATRQVGLDQTLEHWQMCLASISIKHFCSNCRRSQSWWTATLLYWSACLAFVGCGRRPTSVDDALHVKPAGLEARANRRAYEGAPPTIPHVPFGAHCTTCHADNGKVIPTIGIAPANPHFGDRRGGLFANCTQCHVFSGSTGLFVESAFRGLPIIHRVAERAHPEAPPVIPHSTGMRSNCLACHAGIAARPEIVCSHPERANCAQCHVTVESNDMTPNDLAKLP